MQATYEQNYSVAAPIQVWFAAVLGYNLILIDHCQSLMLDRLLDKDGKIEVKMIEPNSYSENAYLLLRRK